MKVKLKTNADGRAKRFTIRFKPDCRHGHYDFLQQRFVAPFRIADHRRFADRGHIVQRYTNVDTVGRGETSVAGRRVDGNRLRGTFSYEITYFDHGDRFNACHIRDVAWSVSR